MELLSMHLLSFFTDCFFYSKNDGRRTIFVQQIEPKVTTLDVANGMVWQVLRKNMSPTFSSGKLKGLMAPITKIADDMITFLNDETSKNPDMDMKKLFQGKNENK